MRGIFSEDKFMLKRMIFGCWIFLTACSSGPVNYVVQEKSVVQTKFDKKKGVLKPTEVTYEVHWEQDNSVKPEGLK